MPINHTSKDVHWAGGFTINVELREKVWVGYFNSDASASYLKP